MLAEKIAYSNDFPINIKIGNITEYPLHYHQDIELVFVLKGEVELKNGCCAYTMVEGSVFTNTGHEVHGIYKTKKENVTAIVQVSNSFFTQFFPRLSKSCYRTYDPDGSGIYLDQLKKILLLILLNYLKKALNYKQKCIDLMIELIDCLDSHFNLFAFNGSVIVNANNDDPVQVKRISRIISYIYAEHSKKITLEDLAEMEHLSTYYLSHLIHSFIGLSFREFLCFASVELSEIPLLDVTKRIPAIAKEIGFSTTSYYEKYFQKWFGKTPSEYRRIYAPLIKSVLRQEQIEYIPISSAIFIVRRTLSYIDSQLSSSSSIDNLKLDVIVDIHKNAIKTLNPLMQVGITARDYLVLGRKLFSSLDALHCSEVMIETDQTEDESLLKYLEKELIIQGFTVTVRTVPKLETVEAYGRDSIAYLPYILYRGILGNSTMRIKLMDPGSSTELNLQGASGVLTSCGIPKPSYYDYTFLSRMQGDLLCWGKHHAVVRLNCSTPAFIAAVYNYSDITNQLCTRSATLHETEDIVDRFNNKLDLSITLSHLSGSFAITKYSLSGQNSIFDLMSKMSFPHAFTPQADLGLSYCSAPKVDVFTEIADETLLVNFSLEDIGAELAVIQKISDL